MFQPLTVMNGRFRKSFKPHCLKHYQYSLDLYLTRFVKREINSPEMRSVVVLTLCTYFWIYFWTYLRPPQMLKFHTFGGRGGESIGGGAGPTRGTGNSNTGNSEIECTLVHSKITTLDLVFLSELKFYGNTECFWNIFLPRAICHDRRAIDPSNRPNLNTVFYTQ